jgi:trimeric autotransporter adhesin
LDFVTATLNFPQGINGIKLVNMFLVNAPVFGGTKNCICLSYQYISTMLKIFLLMLLGWPLFATAQFTGVGTVNPTHTLHVSAASHPLRLEGVQSGSVSDSFLTINAQGVVGKRALAVVSGNGWLLGGNSGLSASQFLGTTDNTPLLIKTNGQASGLIDPQANSRNNAWGFLALSKTSTGQANNAFGYAALNNISGGNFNIAIGDSAGFAINTGLANIAIGANALQSATVATGNLAIGTNALNNTLSSENIALGNNAAAALTSGANNLAIGVNAVSANRTANTMLAIGNNALQQIATGLENLAIGYNAATALTTASYNVIVGNYAYSSATSSSNNTIVGHNAGLAYSGVGNNNTFLGYQAGFTQTGGNGNTYVGANTDVAGNSSVTNSAALGQGVQITASNQVRIGNANVTSIGGQVGWTTFSDARLKTDIEQNVPGLAFISLLRPVTYYYNNAAMAKITGTAAPASTVNAPIRYTGLIAQEVAAAAESIGYPFSGIDKPANAQSPYGIRYAELVVPLIKAVQEMKQLIMQQQAEIDALKKRRN